MRLDQVSLPSQWELLLSHHSEAVDQFIEVARRCEGEVWMRPLAAGKWTPAEVTSHLSEAYQVLHTELVGGPGMRLLGSPLQRWLLRHTLFPRLCRGKPFPSGVRAPRETRPREVEQIAAVALQRLGFLASNFTQELTRGASTETIRLTHAYFGPLSPRQCLRLLIVHTRHHARQLLTLRGELAPR
jgi:hypothetical protein